MKNTKFNQSGFSVLVVALVIAVTAATGLVAWRVVGANTGKTASSQVAATGATQLSPEDAAILARAKELKKIDFDLDGIPNAQDNDDDNDGQNDNVDTDDDNDGVLDNKDDDQDNDGVENDNDDDAAQQAELEESN